MIENVLKTVRDAIDTYYYQKKFKKYNEIATRLEKKASVILKGVKVTITEGARNPIIIEVSYKDKQTTITYPGASIYVDVNTIEDKVSEIAKEFNNQLDNRTESLPTNQETLEALGYYTSEYSEFILIHGTNPLFRVDVWENQIIYNNEYTDILAPYIWQVQAAYHLLTQGRSEEKRRER